MTCMLGSGLGKSEKRLLSQTDAGKPFIRRPRAVCLNTRYAPRNEASGGPGLSLGAAQKSFQTEMCFSFKTGFQTPMGCTAGEESGISSSVSAAGWDASPIHPAPLPCCACSATAFMLLWPTTRCLPTGGRWGQSFCASLSARWANGLLFVTREELTRYRPRPLIVPALGKTCFKQRSGF